MSLGNLGSVETSSGFRSSQSGSLLTSMQEGNDSKNSSWSSSQQLLIRMSVHKITDSSNKY